MTQQIKTCKRKTLDDEFYTMYKDCVRELHKYDLRGKKIICPCDNKNSNIYKYLKDCYYDVKYDDKEWRNIDYSKYDLEYVKKLQQENEQLKDNWNKLKEYIRKNIIYDDVGMKILDPSPLEDYMQELEQGSDSNG